MVGEHLKVLATPAHSHRMVLLVPAVSCSPFNLRTLVCGEHLWGEPFNRLSLSLSCAAVFHAPPPYRTMYS